MASTTVTALPTGWEQRLGRVDWFHILAAGRIRRRLPICRGGRT
ncbi:MAG: hypothetical protein U1B80_06405 [Anaerolineaceae bacterium]|nr:hypothetical protein [Anaerolineaceae bacterium]